MDENTIKLENFKKILNMRSMGYQELALKCGMDPRQIQNVLAGRSPLGKKLISRFAPKLDVDEKEFYRWDQSVDIGSEPVEVADAMKVTKEIMTTAKRIGDEWSVRVVRQALTTIQKGVIREVERRELIKELDQLRREVDILKRQMGITDSGLPQAASPARRRAAKK